MAKRLQEHLNSQYLELAQKLRPRNSVRKIVAYVESYDDIFFWRTVLGDFETDRIKFEVMLPSRHTLCKGKKAALMNKLGPSLGDYMIACVDADYDYLVQGATEISRTLISSPFILHTYAYAIENYQCYAPALHTACVPDPPWLPPDSSPCAPSHGIPPERWHCSPCGSSRLSSSPARRRMRHVPWGP